MIWNFILIGGLQKLTLTDYPGKLACTVFLAGCNFRCPWCFSPEFVLSEKIKNNPPILEKELFKFLEQRKKSLDAVCLDGGEPTLHQDLPEFCQRIKKMGYKVKLATNGSQPAMLQRLVEKQLVDYVAMDIKAPKEKYTQAIGFPNCSPHYLLHNLEKSIVLLKQGIIEHEFRTTFVPGILVKDDILKIANWLKPAKKYYLQNFIAQKTLDSSFETCQPESSEELFTSQKAISPFFNVCQVR